MEGARLAVHSENVLPGGGVLIVENYGQRATIHRAGHPATSCNLPLGRLRRPKTSGGVAATLKGSQNNNLTINHPVNHLVDLKFEVAHQPRPSV